MSKILGEGLTFDDVLLVPQFSKVVPMQTSLETNLTKNIKLNIPIIASPMDTVCESEMAIAMAKLGGIGIIHKNLTIEQQSREVELVKEAKVNKEDKKAVTDSDGKLLVGASVSIGSDFEPRAMALYKAGIDVIVIDSAHGHSKNILVAVKFAKDNCPGLDIIAGNIATREAAISLIDAGVDAIRVGIGPGSICTTRVIAGVGVPQITAIMDVYEACAYTDCKIIADGGMKTSGDICKAIGAGASTAMLGQMLAGTTEAPGEIVEIDGKEYKSYVGMGSLAAMKRGSSERYFQNAKEPSKLVPEGIESMISYKGDVKDIVFQIEGGLRSGLGYNGARNILELTQKAKFIKISNSGLKESHPHSLNIIKNAPNYDGSKR
ncbi:IMP dehydrogenase [Mycoplasma sp. P36-A1]|uniref:IMP dehydrogenase n=1 Tax=Mycoplasma sp. P36-A1 TaxID=3252900 RepID=UPI003C2B4AF9